MRSWSSPTRSDPRPRSDPRRRRRFLRSARRPDSLVGREVVVLDAYGDFGHAVVDGAVWTIRHARDVLRSGEVVRVVEQRTDMLVVLGPLP